MSILVDTPRRSSIYFNKFELYGLRGSPLVHTNPLFNNGRLSTDVDDDDDEEYDSYYVTVTETRTQYGLNYVVRLSN